MPRNCWFRLYGLRGLEVGGIMAKSGQRSFMKRQKEIERKKKAEGKMARRHAKKKQAIEVEKQDGAERPQD